MKAKLKFNLPEEKTELLQALHAGDLHSGLLDADRILRNFEKHGGDPVKAIREARTEIADALSRLEE